LGSKNESAKSRSWNRGLLLALTSPSVQPGSPSLLESGNIKKLHKLLIQHSHFGSSKSPVLVKNGGQRPILHFPETPYKTPRAMLQTNPKRQPHINFHNPRLKELTCGTSHSVVQNQILKTSNHLEKASLKEKKLSLQSRLKEKSHTFPLLQCIRIG
jgi:hypothetical protein